MATVKTFSSVSVRDYTDLGQILLYTTSNQPTSVIYNPNTDTYLPNWSNSPYLVITPVIQYNGSTLPLNASGLVISFKRKEGSGSETDLTTGETVSGGILTVSANNIASATSGMLTYVCHVSYTDPEVGVPIDTETSQTYTLISQATELKSAYITGENTFLYNAERTLASTNPIVLTANVSNIPISQCQWQYKNSSGTYTAFPLTYNTSNHTATLYVDAREPDIWLNGGRTATIRLHTPENDIFDIHDIKKIYDGVAGNASLVAQLSNQTHYVPCDSSGNVTSWNGAATEIHVYEGGDDVTSTWSITTNLGSGLTGTYNSSTHTFTPSGLTADTSYCDFVCTKQDYSTITVRYTITKTRMGADGQSPEVYSLGVSALAINKNISNVYSPTSITINATKTVGNTTTAYPCRFTIEETTNGSTYGSPVYTSSSNESSKSGITPSSTSVKAMRIKMYAAGGTTNELDNQIVVITNDGEKGADGDDGINGISMGLGNYQDVLPCKSNGYTSQAKTITIPFFAYSGIARIPVTASATSLPSGITVNTNTAGDATHDGTLTLSVANNSALGDASRITGDITIRLSCTYNTQTQSADYKYTYTKSLAAVDAVLFEIYSEDGGVIRNSSGSTTLQIHMVSGNTDVTPTSIQWAKYESGTYTNITGATSTSLTVTGDDVDDLAFFRATATYGGKSYVAYYTVDDIVDPYMSYTFATVQEFKNSIGFGAIYTRVYQNGVEVDPIKSTTFSDVAPSAPSTGDYYYHLDKTNKKCILKKYNGSSWVNASSSGNDADTFVYRYYRCDKNGDAMDTSSAYTQSSNQARALYVDPSLIDGRMQFICEVSNT